MKFDKAYFYNLAKDLLTTPSPSGYCHQIINKIEAYAQKLNLTCERTKKGNVVITFRGKSEDYCVGLSAHVDTLGLMVRSINSDGTLSITTIGGNQLNSLIGEYCTIFTRDDKNYSGTILTTSYSSHVYDDTSKKGANLNDFMIRIDEPVKSNKDTLALGIQNGDFVAIDPKTTIINDFIKSRHLDDKISVAIIFTVFKMFIENNIIPNKTIKFIVSTYEEVGHGASHIPLEIDELIAVDMGCIGKDLACTEYDVSICAKDSSGPYDYLMTSKLVEIAKQEKINFAVDIYPYYGSDASAALRGGNNIKAALIGPGVHASHGMERTHLDGCLSTMKLLAKYLI
jgi:putative aminopeptidase FrvX